MKGKILIVDDLADFRKLLRGALEDNNIITEADSKAALEKALTQEQPELVLEFLANLAAFFRVEGNVQALLDRGTPAQILDFIRGCGCREGGRVQRS